MSDSANRQDVPPTHKIFQTRYLGPIIIGPDGRCTCSCGDKCPLGRRGMELRCTEGELEAEAERKRIYWDNWLGQN